MAADPTTTAAELRAPQANALRAAGVEKRVIAVSRLSGDRTGRRPSRRP